MMDELTLLQAYSDWLAGQLHPHQVLWGIPMLWWARFGKMAQFLGALTIIVEIVGPERLRVFGNSLHGAVSLSTIRRNFVDAVALARDSLVFLFSSGEKEQAARDRATSSRFAWLDQILTLPVGIACGLAFGKNWWTGVLIAAVSGLFSYVLVTPFLAALLVSCGSFLALAADTMLIEPIAWTLERPAIDRLVKVGGTLLLVAGFHFDLLAS